MVGVEEGGRDGVIDIGRNGGEAQATRLACRLDAILHFTTSGLHCDSIKVLNVK